MATYRAVAPLQIGFRNSILELVQDDITQQPVDVIVNAANSKLAGGGGVDGAIHDAAGPSVMRETAHRYPNGCPTGSAVITEAGELRARYIVHAVGPVWNGGQQNEVLLLASAYYRCFELATQYRCDSIAFPAISAGTFGFPMEQAARVAIDATAQYVMGNGKPHIVRFVVFDRAAYEVYENLLRSLVDA